MTKPCRSLTVGSGPTRASAPSGMCQVSRRGYTAVVRLRVRMMRITMTTSIQSTIDRAALERTLCELGRVEQLSDLGAEGPLMASAGADSLFHCLFGRDSLRMASDLLDDFPAVARATLLDLARLQGVEDNPRGEEQPGRILHEFRAPDDPHAICLSEAGWDFPYYGTVDATP